MHKDEIGVGKDIKLARPKPAEGQNGKGLGIASDSERRHNCFFGCRRSISQRLKHIPVLEQVAGSGSKDAMPIVAPQEGELFVVWLRAGAEVVKHRVGGVIAAPGGVFEQRLCRLCRSCADTIEGGNLLGMAAKNVSQIITGPEQLESTFDRTRRFDDGAVA